MKKWLSAFSYRLSARKEVISMADSRKPTADSLANMVAPNPLIDVQNLNVRFGRQQVLRDVTLSVPRGQTLAVFGFSMVACLGVNDAIKVAMIKWRVPTAALLR